MRVKDKKLAGHIFHIGDCEKTVNKWCFYQQGNDAAQHGYSLRLTDQTAGTVRIINGLFQGPSPIRFIAAALRSCCSFLELKADC